MSYVFRIRPLARLFWLAVLLWMGYVFLYTARHVPAPAVKSAFLVLTSGLCFLVALVVLRGLLRLSRAYGRTWID